MATLLVDKYQDGLPCTVRSSAFERMGLKLPVSTLADQVTWATDLLRPLWRLAVLQVLSAKVMHLDGTSLPVLDREAAGGKRIGALWGYVGDDNGRRVSVHLDRQKDGPEAGGAGSRGHARQP